MSDERDQKALQLAKRNQQFKDRTATLEKRQSGLDAEHNRLEQRLNKMPQEEIDRNPKGYQQLRERYDRVGGLAEKNRATLDRTRQEHKDFQQKHQSGKDATHERPSHNLGHKKNEQGNYRARGRVKESDEKRMGAIQRQKQVPGQNSQTAQTTPQQQTTSPQQSQSGTGGKDSLATYRTNQQTPGEMGNVESKTPGQPQPDLSNVKKLETHGQQSKNTLAKYQSGQSSTHQPGEKLAFAGEKQTSLGAHTKQTPETQQSQTDVSKNSSSQQPMSNQQTNQQPQTGSNSATVTKDSMSQFSTQGGAGKGAEGKSTSTPPPSKGPDKGQGR